MSTEELPPRESMEFDVVIVGAGPSGLAAAIRLKQLNADLTVVVVEKGSEVGAHILSGAVIDPVALDRLIPDWREDADCPLKTQVKDDRFYWMTAGTAIRLPNIMMPPLMNNHHCYVGSLGNVCRWLARKAEALGIEIYPGFAATEVLYDEKGAVRGIATDASSTTSVAKRTRMPCAEGLKRDSRLDPEGRLAAADQDIEIGDVLQGKQGQADGH